MSRTHRPAVTAVLVAGLAGAFVGPPGRLEAGPAAAGRSCPADGMRLTGAIGGQMRAVAVRAPLAYVGSGSGVEVVDFGGGERPHLQAVAQLLPGSMPSAVTDMAFGDEHLYAVTDRGQLRVFDVSKPPAARQIAEIQLPLWRAHHLALVGDVAYVVSEYEAALALVDLSDRAHPTSLGTVPLLHDPSSLAIDGHHAFVGMEVFDVTSPARPRSLGAMSVPGGWGDDAAVHDGLAYVVGRAAGSQFSQLRVLDVTDIRQVRQLGRLDTTVGREALLSAYAERIAVDGDRAYVTQETQQWSLTTPAYGSTVAELLVIDVSAADQPHAVGRFEAPAGMSITDMAAADRLFLTMGDVDGGGSWSDADPAMVGGLWILDRGVSDWPSAIGRYPGFAHADHVLADGARAYVAEAQQVGLAGRTQGMLYALETAHQTPWPVWRESAGAITAMAWMSPTRIVAAMSPYESDRRPHVETIDLLDSWVHVRRGNIVWLTPTRVMDVVAADGHAFLLSMAEDEPARITVVDFAAEGGAAVVATLDVTSSHGRPDVMERVANHLYVGTEAGLQVVDVSDPARPRLVGSDPDLVFDHLATGPGVLFGDRWTEGGDTRLCIVGVGEPSRPRLQAEVVIDRSRRSPDPRDVVAMEASGDRLIVALDDGSVRLYDVSSPVRPVLLQEMPTSARIAEIAVAGCQAVLAGGDGGLLLATLTAGVLPAMSQRAYLPLGAGSGGR